MACQYSMLLKCTGSCGISKEYPRHVAFITLDDCQRDILGHLQACKIRDEAVDNEMKLLLARAGNSY